ncbi:MAG: hypothetical protein JW839_08565 [Candidatus Lokiarchaeota archaeon]|nr:hypothetical protein [Candidatus Lokiarchaeota archaeon]
MSARAQKKQFLERFHDLVKHYERMHEEHEWKQTRISVGAFYRMFLDRFDDAFVDVVNPRIKEKASTLRDKAEELAGFDERATVHDLAEKAVQRLNDLGMELYAMPDVEYLMESSAEVELSVLLACCPAFGYEKDPGGETEKLCCEGTVKALTFGKGQDLQAAVRMYYEKHCRECQQLETIKKELAKHRA